MRSHFSEKEEGAFVTRLCYRHNFSRLFVRGVAPDDEPTNPEGVKSPSVVRGFRPEKPLMKEEREAEDDDEFPARPTNDLRVNF